MAKTKKEVPTIAVEAPVETIVPKAVPVLELIELEINSFKGIDSSKPVVIDFREYKNQNITIAVGNQGRRKTSLAEALLYACGESFDFKLSNFVNIQDNTIAGKFQFKKNGRAYKVNFTKSKFELLKLFRDADDPDAKPVWQTQDSPKELLKSLIGNVATSPMFLKGLKGQDQIDWLYSVLKVPDEVKEKEAKLKAALSEATESRKTANKEFIRVQSALSQNSLYDNWEKSETAFKEVKTIESAHAKVQEVDSRRQKYLNNKNGAAQLRRDIKQQDIEIADLELRLESLKKAKASNEKKATVAEKFVDDNKNVLVEYDAVQKEYMEVNTYIQNRNTWLSTVKQKKEMDDFQSMVIKLDAQKTLLVQDIKNLLTSVLPPIEGLEVETEKNIDQNREMGIYLYGKTPAQLSESELTGLYLQILETQNVTMAVIENINNFGTDTIRILNDLAARGVKVFGTLMDASQDDLAIVFKEKIVLETKLG